MRGVRFVNKRFDSSSGAVVKSGIDGVGFVYSSGFPGAFGWGGSSALVMWVVVVWEGSDRTRVVGAYVWMKMRNLQGADAPVEGRVVGVVTDAVQAATNADF